MKIKTLFSRGREYFTRQRLVSFSMLGKIIGLILILTFSPIALVQAETPAQITYSTEIKLDTTKSFPLVLAQKDFIKFEVTESNYDRIEREKRETAEAKTQNERRTAKRDVLARDYRLVRSNPDLATKRVLIKRAAAAYGINWKILEAVWEVESGKSWDTSKHSPAGASGPMQFMPGTWKKYGVDGNGDGRADIYSAEDSLYAAANLLAQAGAASGAIDSALLSYNRAQWYVDKVKRVAASIE